MNKVKLHIITFLFLCLGLLSCSKGIADLTDPGFSDGFTTPRLVIRGTVTNEAGEALQGIYIALPEIVTDIESVMEYYNAAYTDSQGQYSIIRYRGQEIPDEIIVAASDPAGIYMGQEHVFSVEYDYVTNSYNENIPFNGFVIADFVMQMKAE